MPVRAVTGHRRRRHHHRQVEAVTGSLAVLVLVLSLVGLRHQQANLTRLMVHPSPAAAAPSSGAGEHGPPQQDGADRTVDGSVAELPGVSAAFRTRIPADTRQVVLATGLGRNSSRATVSLWNRTAQNRWEQAADWPAHNGLRGWTDHHTDSDLRSPIGVYTLSDAGGRRSDPGTRLPYHQDDLFEAEGTGFTGESLAGSFDYVVAIDYNRVSGNTPLDPRRPEGAQRGGGIWLHVDHGGPTHGCVTLTQDHMVELLRQLDPAAHPVIVMGDAASLAA